MANLADGEPRGAAAPSLRLRGSLLAGVALTAAAALRKRLRRHERIVVARALAEDHRRTAADVHDLVMQELSMALASARTLADDPALAPTAGAVVSAGERALAGARGIVSGLSGRESALVAETVQAAVQTAVRGTRLSFDAAQVPGELRADACTSDALVHVSREAVTNAVKHGGANSIEVVLRHEDEWGLTVRDDGCGFVPGEQPLGFGLQSMHECAAALGGSLLVSSTPGAGTTVEMRLP
jgi:signal transduction histidine kinase